MPELFATDESKIIDIKNEIIKDVEHNKPKREANNNFLNALTLGSEKFSTSNFRDIMVNSREE